MAKKVWVLRLEDGTHTVELKHRSWSEKREIFVDGVLVGSFTKSSDAGPQQFTVSGHACLLETPQYELFVDGTLLLDEEAFWSQASRLERWPLVEAILRDILRIKRDS